MSGGRNRKQKGSRVEREFVKLLNAAGIPAKRVPLSGAVVGFKGDVSIMDGKLIAEVKSRKNGQGFTVIEKWLGENDLLFLKRNRQNPLVVLQWNLLVSLLGTLVEEEERWSL